MKTVCVRNHVLICWPRNLIRAMLRADPRNLLGSRTGEQMVLTHPLSRALLVVVTVLSVAICGAQVASANWYGKTGLYDACYSPNQADNKTHTIGYNDLDIATGWNHAWVEDNVLDPTAVNTTYHSTIQSKTDLVALDLNYTTYCGLSWYSGPGWNIGHTKCFSRTGGAGSDCQKHQARYDLGYVWDVTDPEIRCLIAHESGHSLGLDHLDFTTAVDVMQGGVTLGVACAPISYTTHDRGHLTNDLDN